MRPTCGLENKDNYLTFYDFFLNNYIHKFMFWKFYELFHLFFICLCLEINDLDVSCTSNQS